jgi:uncharacterized protein (TIGR03663 family)
MPSTLLADKARTSDPAAPAPALRDFRWWLVCAGILLVAAVFRFISLDLKPLHHDEGVNGYFLLRLLHSGFYRYDPANYHGPSLYYLAALTSALNVVFRGRAGLDTFAMRMLPALFGMATVWLILGLRPRIGKIAAAAAASMVALSPGAVFLSRYFIHETPFVFFMLAMVVAALRYRETGRTYHLLLAACSAALLFATKETAIISAGVVLIAYLCAKAYIALRSGRGARAGKPKMSAASSAAIYSNRGAWLLAVLLFAAVTVLLFSSFFTNFPRGFYDAFASLRIWKATAVTAYRQPWYRYLQWIAPEEMLPLLLGTVGALVAFWRARSRFAVFVGLWSLGTLAAYSLVPYKTPWLALNMIVPFAIGGGVAVQEIYAMCRNGAGSRPANWILAASGLTLLLPAVQAVTLNFYRYDDGRYAYVYAQTERGFLRLIDDVNALATRGGAGGNTTIAVLSPEYWPLPWYLRNYRNVAYHGRMLPTDASIVIASAAEEAQMYQQFGRQYHRLESYPLRPGLRLVLFARQDLSPSKRPETEVGFRRFRNGPRP